MFTRGTKSRFIRQKKISEHDDRTMEKKKD